MRHAAIVDRFANEKAVLLVGEAETTVTWPKHLLPDDTQEGDILTVSISIDEGATRKARVEATELLREVIEQNRDLTK